MSNTGKLIDFAMVGALTAVLLVVSFGASTRSGGADIKVPAEFKSK